MNTNVNEREKDARLHELLTGEKTHYVDVKPMGGNCVNCDYLVDEWFIVNTEDEVPNYTTSHDAIHTAEDALSVELREDYAAILDWRVNQGKQRLVQDTEIGDPNYQYENCRTNYTAVFSLIHATPAQRVEAMLAVLERAKEAK